MRVGLRCTWCSSFFFRGIYNEVMVFLGAGRRREGMYRCLALAIRQGVEGGFDMLVRRFVPVGAVQRQDIQFLF